MTDTVPPVPILCACGNQIGEEVSVQGIMLIHAGGGLWHELRGNCVQCAVPFYWSIKDKQISRAIIARKEISMPDQEEGE
jgi:hypothetical protein